MSMKKYSNHKGVTLIEVLVAIVITSIGILGFTSLQFLGLNSNQSAYSRSQASFIATSLSERMRANIEGVNLEQYHGRDSSPAAPAVFDCTAIPSPYCDARNNNGVAVAAESCNATQLATYDFFIAVCGASSNDYTDLSERTSLLADLLPNGRIQIQCNDGVTCPPFSDHTIIVSWDEQDEDATNSAGDNVDGSLRTRSRTKSVSYRFNP